MAFAPLRGQPLLRRSLIKALAAESLGHAVLLTGPSGSGKKTWGRALAMALLCPERRGGEPCDGCLSCRQFKSGNHPRFFYLEPAERWLKTDQVRQVRGKFFLEGGNRVCLINHADRMTAEAASSLLKILEEPPDGLYFILLAEYPHRLFPTILSRCRRFSLQPLSEEDIMDILEMEAAVPREQAALPARLCGGWPGRALELAKDPAFARRLEEAGALAADLAAGSLDGGEIVRRAAMLAEREDLLPFLELVYLHYRDCLVELLCGKETLKVIPGGSRLIFAGLSPASLEQALALLHRLMQELRETNVNRRLALEGLLIMLQRGFEQCSG